MWFKKKCFEVVTETVNDAVYIFELTFQDGTVFQLTEITEHQLYTGLYHYQRIEASNLSTAKEIMRNLFCKSIFCPDKNTMIKGEVKKITLLSETYKPKTFTYTKEI